MAAYRGASLDERLEIADRLVSEVRPRLALLLFRLCPPEAVEDLVQETLIAIALKLHTCSHTTDVGIRGWCYGIANHKRADYFRNKHVKRATLFDRDVCEDLIDASADARRIADEERELLNFALDLLGEVDPSAVELLLLYYIDDLSLDQLALLTQSTKGAVHMRIHRACQKAGKLVKSKLKHE